MKLDKIAPINTTWGACHGNNYKWQGTCVTKSNIKTIEQSITEKIPVLQNPRTGKFYLKTQLNYSENEGLYYYGEIEDYYISAVDFLAKVQQSNNKLKTKRELSDAKKASKGLFLSISDETIPCKYITKKRMIGKGSVSLPGGGYTDSVIMDIDYIDSDGVQKNGKAMLKEWHKNKCFVNGFVKLLK